MIKYIFITIFFINILLPHSNQDTEISRLKTKISKLEERVQYLESLILKNSDRKEISSEKWKNKSNWRKLKVDMSMDRVEMLLGIPVNVEGGNRTRWEYDNNKGWESYVIFQYGKLRSWKEPTE